MVAARLLPHNELCCLGVVAVAPPGYCMGNGAAKKCPKGTFTDAFNTLTYWYVVLLFGCQLYLSECTCVVCDGMKVRT
jgi:hypothetical protein